MKRTISALLIAPLTVFNLYAQTEPPGTMDSLSRPSSDVPTTNTQRTDEIKTFQSGTITTNCIDVEVQGRLCGERAAKWCKDHQESFNCRNFKSMTSPTTTPPPVNKNY